MLKTIKDAVEEVTGLKINKNTDRGSTLWLDVYFIISLES